jgi:hypothetical protein
VPAGTLSPKDQALLDAINDPNIQVELYTTKDNYFDSKDGTKDHPLIPAAYDGSVVQSVTVSEGIEEEITLPENGCSIATGELETVIVGSSVTKTKNIVITTQVFNLDVAKNIESVGISNAGSDAIHEVIESFYGGLNDPGGNYKSGYDANHKKAMAVDPSLNQYWPDNFSRTKEVGVTNGKTRVPLMPYPKSSGTGKKPDTHN